MSLLENNHAKNELALHQQKATIREIPDAKSQKFINRISILKKYKLTRFIHTRPHHPLSRIF